MLRAARDLETLRQNLRLECSQLREEVREAKAELARLQAHRRRPSRRARPEGGAELKSRLLRSAAKDAGPVHRAQDECTIRLTYVRATYRRSTILQSFA
jgi:hypothetical protein